MSRSTSAPLAIAAALLLLGACSSPPGAHENAVPPGVSLQPSPAVTTTGSLVLPGVTPIADTTAAAVPAAPAANAAPDMTPPADTTATADTTAGRIP
jgi:hypothetical protein